MGLVPDGVEISASRARPGDAILLSGTIGDHGMAIMSVREGLEFEGEIRSDTAPLNGLVEAMFSGLDQERSMHVLRDPTRGGLAASLCEIATASGMGVEVNASAIPVREDVRGACEILGLDPLFVANEGKLVAFVAEESSESVLSAMRQHPMGRNAVRIGRCLAEHKSMVLLKTEIGGTRILDLPFSEQLPRIC